MKSIFYVIYICFVLPYISYAQELKLDQICTILENEKQREYYDYLVNRFTISDFDDRYLNFNNTYIHTIFTTNIDDLVYGIYKDNVNQ